MSPSGSGLYPCAAAALLFASCWSCGSLALRFAFAGEKGPEGIVKPIMVGLACELTLFGLMIHYPINGRILYIGLLLAPILGWIAVHRPQPAQWLARLEAQGDVLARVPFWMVAVAVGVIGYAVRYAFLPAVDFDNNSEHLRLWTELAHNHRFAFNPLDQVWNVEPFAVDLVRAIPSVVAARDARCAVGLGLLALILRQLWVIGGRLNLGDADRLLLIVLFASTPMTGWLVSAMQAELFLALLAAAGVRLLLDARAEIASSDATAILAVAALCCAAKLPGAVLGVFLLLAAAPQLIAVKRQGATLIDPRRQWPILAFVLIFAVMALDSYVTAWRVTGNPLFPLFNGRFKSPFYPPENFADTRWLKGVSPKSVLGLFFRTSQFGENKDYVAGFQYLFLLPLGLLALPWRTRRDVAVAIALPLVGFSVMMFSQTQYMRYLFPALPLACLAIGALFAPGSWAASGKRSLRAFAGLCIALDLFFFPGISYLFETSPQLAYQESGKATITAVLSPVKALVGRLNHDAPGEAVLFPEFSPLGASLIGEPLYVNWYAPGRSQRYAGIHSEADVDAFLRAEKAMHVIWDLSDEAAPGKPAGFLHAYLTHHAAPEAMASGYISYAVSAQPPLYHPLFDLEQAVASKSSVLEPAPGAAPFLPAGGLDVTAQPLVVARLSTNWTRIMRYHAQFRCTTADGYFIAQVNWDRGAPYYRLVKCAAAPVDFEEAFPVPEGASQAIIYATVRDTADAALSQLVLEAN